VAPLGFGAAFGVLCEDRPDESGDEPVAIAPGLGEHISHEMYPTPLPGRVQQAGDGGFEPFVSIGDHQLHATQSAPGQLAQEFRPECLGLGWSDVHAEDFPSAVGVDADRNDDGNRDNTTGLPDLYISGIQPDIWMRLAQGETAGT
jgi:hypothetical protein